MDGGRFGGTCETKETSNFGGGTSNVNMDAPDRLPSEPLSMLSWSFNLFRIRGIQLSVHVASSCSSASIVAPELSMREALRTASSAVATL